MLFDLLIVFLIIVIAMVLGLTVHPLFWLILLIAAVFFFARGGSRHW